VDDSIVRGTTSQQIIQMARDAGAKRVYFASASPPVRYPNVYGIDMPAASELIAHDRTEAEVEAALGCDRLIFQDLGDLIEAVQKRGKSLVDRFDTSVFDAVYVTNDVTSDYLDALERERNDGAKSLARGEDTVLELYNSA
jgi:amidophosphoribosyltransferase